MQTVTLENTTFVVLRVRQGQVELVSSDGEIKYVPTTSFDFSKVQSVPIDFFDNFVPLNDRPPGWLHEIRQARITSLRKPRVSKPRSKKAVPEPGATTTKRTRRKKQTTQELASELSSKLPADIAAIFAQAAKMLK